MSLCDELRIEKGKEGSFLRKFFQGFIRSSSVVVSPPPFLGGFHPVRNITGKSIPALCFLVQPWSKLFIKLVQKS